MYNFISEYQPLKGKTQLIAYALIGVLLFLGAIVVYLNGGEQYILFNVMYIPIVLAATLFFIPGGILTGLFAGILVGLLMPVDQFSFSVLYHLGFFMLIGFLVGKVTSDFTKHNHRTKDEINYISSTYAKTLKSYAKLVEMRDEQTSLHCERVAYNAWVIGKEIKLDKHSLKSLYWAGILHDLGKIGISEDILLKQGRLSKEEFETIKVHSEMGYDFLINLTEDLMPIAIGVLTHHERWNGKGYPYGKKAKEIPLFGRILMIVDVFETLTNNRPYKKAVEPEVAIQSIMDKKGEYFDPELVDIFLKLYKDKKIWIVNKHFVADSDFSKEALTNSVPLKKRGKTTTKKNSTV